MSEQKTHQYCIQLQWTGNTGQGTASYRRYERSHTITADNKPPIFGSSDPAFLGDPLKYNPEELFVASLSSCHMLWYLHLCTTHKIVVTDYIDRPEGTMVETEDGSGQFVEVILKPTITVKAGFETAFVEDIHHQAHQKCFIANSVNFPVRCEPVTHIA